MTRRVIYRFFAIEREDEGSWKIITKRIYLRVRVERKKKRGARVLRDDSTCLARLSPRDPRILQTMVDSYARGCLARPFRQVRPVLIAIESSSRLRPIEN